ncbi:MAG: hypothetical protein K1X63_12155 [Chitinophagales bacterium]|nr:hypothetical protein [Chitinophagales bacterium]
MFFVSDSEEFKKSKIRDYLNGEPMIAILLAAANWEWSVGRCILFFGNRPNLELRYSLAHCYGLDRYKSLWKEELCDNDASIPRLPILIKQWNDFALAFEFRHRLIHGRGTCTRNMATKPIEMMIEATSDLYEFARLRGTNLNSRLVVRRKNKQV